MNRIVALFVGLAFMRTEVSSEIKWCLAPSCSSDCGVQKIEYPERTGQHPWHVGVYDKGKSPYSLICSGSIISTVLVLSAASCFWSETEKLLPASRFAIAAGKVYREWDDPRDSQAQKRDVAEIKVPTGYDGKRGDYRYDIAVIFFATAFTYNNLIRPVCIDYDQDLERRQLHTSTGTVMSWGESANETVTRNKDVTYMKYVDGTQCLFNVPRSFVKHLTTDKFCARTDRDGKLCKDDLGGGLAFEEGDKGLFLNSRYYLRGVVSISPPTDSDCSTFTATTFGWIYAYRDFIQEQLTDIGRNHFQCQDGNVISTSHLCDGAVHCADGSDETLSACSNAVCPRELFKCTYGGCVNAEVCDGKQECIDGSDEDKAACDRQSASALLNNGTQGCRLPPYPKHGTYKVINKADAKPGDILDNFYLEYECDDEYRLVGKPSLYCYREYKPQDRSSCIKMCRLDPHPSVEYLCHVPGSNGGTRPCELYEPGGTVVTANCRSPNYYTAQFLRNMKCTNGAWDYVATCLAVCGATTPKGEILVAGGRPSEKGEVPWHVAIYDKKTNPFDQICGGSIISPSVVVTAAHCFWNNANHMSWPASDFAVAAGKIYRSWSDERDTNVQMSDVAEIKIPDRFLGVQTNFEDDLALLVLSSSFVYDVHIRPVCLELGILFDRKQLAVGNLGKVAGWGLTDEQGTTPQKLQVVDLPYIDIKKCLSEAPRYFREYITGDKICAGYSNGTAALCKGDSGGGLTFPEIFGGEKRFYLRGVVSTAPNNKNECNTYAVTTFTHLIRHEYFIKQNFFGQ